VLATELYTEAAQNTGRNYTYAITKTDKQADSDKHYCCLVVHRPTLTS